MITVAKLIKKGSMTNIRNGISKCFPSFFITALGGKKGIIMLEVIPIIWVLFVLLGATLGSWGIVHTAVLNSIAARNYSLFLFNHRSDLSYLRDFGSANYSSLTSDVRQKYYRSDVSNGHGKRFAFISSEKKVDGGHDNIPATLRRVDFRNEPYYDRTDFLSPAEHTQIRSIVDSNRNENKKVGPAWIMVGYGICLSADCGD